VNGILLVDKPEGATSADVVRMLKRPLGGAKVGHLGTLDPFASGLLPLCIGEATKVARYLLLEDKTYTGTIRLGVATDTLDRTGRVTETAAAPALDTATLDAVAARFTGSQLQTPPMYSALKRDGVPLYKLARRGVEVEREPRRITIHRLALACAGGPDVTFEVACSKGTYVRVLAADLGRALGTVAHLLALRRTQVGTFDVTAASSPATLSATPATTWPIVPIERALAGLARFALPPADIALLQRGQQAPLRALPGGRTGETALVTAGDDRVAAVIETAGPEGAWRLVRLLVPA
jgi:tRNA pseudouridine55 synthase